LRILLLSAYDALSHQYWRTGLVEHFPAIDWTVLALPPRFFRYRVRANPISWLTAERDVLKANYDLVIATSLVDIATLRGLVPSLAQTPLWLYCHENQFAYPVSTHQGHQTQHELEAKMVFLYACMAADKISFNSQWNRDTALRGLRQLLEAMPEKIDTGLLDTISAKTDITPVPLNSSHLEKHAPEKRAAEKQVTTDNSRWRLLWNHRWEYDKGPDLLQAFVEQLAQSQLVCELNIVGQQFRQQPAAFAAIEQIIINSPLLSCQHWGYLTQQVDYQALLQNSDVVVSTAEHDFQGIAVLEAVRAGCVPLLPSALVYPEIFPADYLYPVGLEHKHSAAAMVQQLEDWRAFGLPTVPNIDSFEWNHQLPVYQRAIESLV
jgi:glycosyltransferase involved in cell wall biosynthesis